MAESDEKISQDAAEKAYVQAAEALIVAPTEVAAAPAEAKVAKVARPKAVAPRTVKTDAPKPKAARVKSAKTVATKPKSVRRAGAVKSAAGRKNSSPVAKLKDTIMVAKSKDYVKTIKGAFEGVTAKAKAGIEKGTALAGEATEFTKGNAEAMVQSGRILAAGMKDFGQTFLTEARAAAATANADLKDLAEVKGPADLVKLQGDIARRNFEQAVAFGSQTSEALLKIAGEAYAPISSRIAVAMEKVRKAA